VPILWPSVALSLLKVLSEIFVTQMELVEESKATPKGFEPTLKVPTETPSVGLSLLTVLEFRFVTQMELVEESKMT